MIFTRALSRPALRHLPGLFAGTRPGRAPFQARLEALEDRALLSVSTVVPDPQFVGPQLAPSPYYSITGAGNNLANPTWGQAGNDLYRGIVASNYGDGISTPSGQDLPSARLISNVVGAQPFSIPDAADRSVFIYVWGQFIDHDLDDTPDGGASDPIPVPAGDPQFDPDDTGTQTLPFTRSLTDPATGTSTSNPLNQPTVITSFLDGSMIYGSDPTTAAALRTFVGGQLKTSAGDLLPLDTAGLPMENDGTYPEQDLFMAGDTRVNENLDLTALQTLFVREHNRQADILAQENPTWTDEELYQGARQIVIAEIQSITFNEYLPALLSPGAVTPYTGYNPDVYPGIAAEFSEAAFRFGHSQVDDGVQFLNNDGSNFSFTYTLPDGTQVPVNTPSDIFFGNTGVSLDDATSNPYILEPAGVEDSLLKYMSTDVAQSVDTEMVDSIRNVLFGAPGSGAGGQDLFALDIQRGRDVGLPTYNETRVAYGLPAVTSFSQITSNTTLQSELQSLYGNVNNVELIVGGLAEDHVPGSAMGPTFQAIIANQFERTRDGDRLWYQNTFSGAALQAINDTTLADVIEENSSVTNLQPNVFFFDASASPQVKASAVEDTYTVGGTRSRSIPSCWCWTPRIWRAPP